MEANIVTKSTTVTTASVLLDRSVVTAKGKKMANWVLASRHHSSHPQLQGSRPKKSLTDRGLSALLFRVFKPTRF